MEVEKIKIVKVDEATFLVEELFRRTFGEPPPAFPIHYVVFHKVAASIFEVIGYYHLTLSEEYALVGGLCVDSRYRNQGLGEQLSRIAFEDAGERKAFFAYLGNPISDSIARRVGYVETQHKHLFVKWMKAISGDEKEKLITEVAAVGPF
jgi:ribosomal protein S18 acetylase RimI-like enzyme